MKHPGWSQSSAPGVVVKRPDRAHVGTVKVRVRARGGRGSLGWLNLQRSASFRLCLDGHALTILHTWILSHTLPAVAPTPR